MNAIYFPLQFFRAIFLEIETPKFLLLTIIFFLLNIDNDFIMKFKSALLLSSYTKTIS